MVRTNDIVQNWSEFGRVGQDGSELVVRINGIVHIIYLVRIDQFYLVGDERLCIR